MKHVIWAGALLLGGSLYAEDLHFGGCMCAQHEEKVAPYVRVHADVMVHADSVYDADDADAEDFNLQTHTHMQVEISPFENWFIRAQMKLEQSHTHGGEEDEHEEEGEGHEEHDHEVTGDQYFEDHLLFMEEIMLVYAPGNWELFVGKFNPVSGLDQHAFPGIYGYEIEEEYSVLGRLGAGALYQIDTDSFGQHRVEVSGFCRDTTFLNESLLSGNDEPEGRDEGGVANTDDFSSYSLSVTGDDVLFAAVGNTIHEFDYVLAYVSQDEGYGAEDGHVAEERSVVGGLYTITWSEDLQMRMVGEYKNIENYGTHAGEDLQIGTAGYGVYYDGWELGGSYTLLDSNEEPDGHHMQASLGYVFDSGLGVHGGWKSEEEEGEQAKSLGLTVSFHGVF